LIAHLQLRLMKKGELKFCKLKCNEKLHVSLFDKTKEGTVSHVIFLDLVAVALVDLLNLHAVGHQQLLAVLGQLHVLQGVALQLLSLNHKQ
jgi:hypothetical protein